MSEKKEHFDNLAQKIRGKDPSWLRIMQEYFASFAGIQKISPKIQKALQNAHEKTEGILSEVKK